MFRLIAWLQEVPAPELPPSFLDNVRAFLDTPAPYSPLSEYLLILFLLWLLARRQRPRPDFGGQAQNVLEEKFKKGEIDRTTYEKYRQELSMRLKKE
jgi:hypothetical protein